MTVAIPLRRIPDTAPSVPPTIDITSWPSSDSLKPLSVTSEFVKYIEIVHKYIQIKIV